MTNTITDLTDYMFTASNIDHFTKHIIRVNTIPKTSTNHLEKYKCSVLLPAKSQPIFPLVKENKKRLNNYYNVGQRDPLFWCFYILKHGYFKYEMEIHNQYFIIEKNEKFKYIETLRQNKDMLKLHKIKPFTEIEDDLANKPKISVKTFFALCIMEQINVMVVDGRKIYEIICNEQPIHIIHRNKKTGEHSIEQNTDVNTVTKYRDSYFVCSTLDDTLKSISSYTVGQLLELCEKLNITVPSKNDNNKKLTKHDIYELLILHY